MGNESIRLGRIYITEKSGLFSKTVRLNVAQVILGSTGILLLLHTDLQRSRAVSFLQVLSKLFMEIFCAGFEEESKQVSGVVFSITLVRETFLSHNRKYQNSITQSCVCGHAQKS